MSAIGDAYRAFAAACDRTPDLGGAIYVICGDWQIHLACSKGDDQDNLKALCRAAFQAAENGGGKYDPELAAKIEEILAEEPEPK